MEKSQHSQLSKSSKPLNILYLHQYFATLSSSTSVRSFIFSQKLVEYGHHVTVITTDAFMKKEEPYKVENGVKYYQIAGVNILAVESNYSNFLNKRKRISEFLRFMRQAEEIGKKLTNIDLIFATSTPLTIGIPAMRLSKKLKAPFIFEVRDLWPEAPIQMGYIRSKIVQNFLRYVEKRIYKKAAHVICLSPGMAKGVHECGIPTKKTSVIPNLADLELFTEANINQTLKQELISKWDLKGEFVVSHIGAMGEANGLQYLLDAAEILQKCDINNIKFLIVGNGKTKPHLEAVSKQKGLKNVIFSDMITKRDVPTYVDLANITITSFLPKPILATNSPNKFFDALAAGKPIIVNSNGWTKDIVEKHEIGYYVDYKYPQQLADRLVKLMGEKEQLQSLQSKIKEIAYTEFSAETAAKNLLAIIEQTAAEGGKKG
ncbi:glycosyltransferase family 4 protein [Listeria sp. PSOL-1]|uniref:glycosyltransferase family 4 protein n=1 Tax=Listeria sp. PSOL-1 TaxID=1844999 RepID=UPI0013D36C27|nr:glycosyltransferase family 4 protein [Listeria sp. PSOL-1]